MPEPVTNVEIEDVLSSIRKLVADERRIAEPKNPPYRERLVLTPALRVREAPKPAAESSATEVSPSPILLSDPVEPDADTGALLDPPDIDAIPRDARLSDFGSVAGAFPDVDTFRDARMDPSEPEADVDDETEAPTGHARLELGRLIEEEVAAALAEVDFGPQRDDATTHSDTSDEEASGDAHPEDDEASMDMVGGLSDPAEDLPDTWPVDDTADADERPEAQMTGEGTSGHPDSVAEISQPAKKPLLTLEEKVAALGRLVARGSNDFEEERDTVESDEIAAVVEPMAWPDQAPFDEMVEPDPLPESNVVRSEGIWSRGRTDDPVAPVQDETSTASEDTHEPVEDTDATCADHAVTLGSDMSRLDSQPAVAPEMPLDPEMLRAMVVEIVRSELQGALGERITRNVRKLVRREIHRMLISQEFE